MKDRDLYSIQEARQRLGGISRNTIYLMLRSGQLQSVVLGCRRFISAQAIADLISASTTTASPAIDAIRSRKRNLTRSGLSLPNNVRVRHRNLGR